MMADVGLSWDHYFRGVEDWDRVSSMWDAITDLAGDIYTFSILCAPQDDEECKIMQGISYMCQAAFMNLLV